MYLWILVKPFIYVVRENLWSKLIKLGLRGKIFNIVKSIYSSIKSRVKYCNQLSEDFECMLGVRQGECLSPFLFSMFLNDLESVLAESGINGIDVDNFKLFLVLYADDIIIFANNAEELQHNLNVFHEYCKRWKLVVNVDKTKVMIFRKGGRLPNNISFHYNDIAIEIVSKFNYLGVVFTTGGSFSDAQRTLAGQSLKAIFKMNKYLYKYTDITVKHRLDLFDKLISPILNYGSEVWGFVKGDAIERIHMQLCKSLLGVKRSTQNDFIYGELGRLNCQTSRYFNIIKYWVKILHTNSNKFNKKVYLTLLSDCERYPNKKSWCSLLRDLLSTIGFFIRCLVFSGCRSRYCISCSYLTATYR